MSNTPTIPPGNTPPVPPFWRNEDDWIVLIEFLRSDDEEDRARGAEAIGYMLSFAQMTDTRMLALVGDPKADAYELLFSFSSPVNKAEFLRLLQANDARPAKSSRFLFRIEPRSKPPSPSDECCPRTSYSKSRQWQPCYSGAVRAPSSNAHILIAKAV
jgi:hypothetical protein